MSLKEETDEFQLNKEIMEFLEQVKYIKNVSRKRLRSSLGEKCFRNSKIFSDNLKKFKNEDNNIQKKDAVKKYSRISQTLFL